jgi:hypothetical protein
VDLAKKELHAHILPSSSPQESHVPVDQDVAPQDVDNGS